MVVVVVIFVGVAVDGAGRDGAAAARAGCYFDKCVACKAGTAAVGWSLRKGDG